MNAALASLVVYAVGARAVSHTTLVSVDQCATVNADLVVPVLNGNFDFGHINTCLCLSQINTFMGTNTVAVSATALAGKDETIQALVTLITSSSSHSSCTYPDHGVGVCEAGNPCGFTCIDGYTLSPPAHPTTCACESPKTVCNGVCANVKACSSKRAAANDLEGLLRREPGLLGWDAKERHLEREVDKGKMREAKRERKRSLGRRLGERLGCNLGWEACGVFGGSRTAWECVDTTNDLESCGGCTIPISLPFSQLALDDLLTFGVDCTALPGVRDVSCVRGACAVRICERGWVVSRDGQRCQRANTNTDANNIFYGGYERDYEVRDTESENKWTLEHR